MAMMVWMLLVVLAMAAMAQGADLFSVDNVAAGHRRVVAHDYHDFGDHKSTDNMEGTYCDRQLGECNISEEELEMMMESEISQQGRQRFIGYGALERNSVPCSRRGQSYYNCRRHDKANPYTRGCSVITRCKRFTD